MNVEEWKGLLQTAAPHLRQILTVLYTWGPRWSELLNLQWSDVDRPRKEFTLRHTKNGEVRIVPMTPEVYRVFTDLWRLDTQRVFLYNGKPVRDVKTAFKKPVGRQVSRTFGCTICGIRQVRILGEPGWTPQRR